MIDPIRRPSGRKTRPREQPSAPWQLPLTQSADVFAVQALAKGIANEGQQQRAWDYITRILCETDRMTFWPGGEDGRRATDFAEGKRWVGVQLRRIEKLRPDMTGLGLPPSHENSTT
jgi:hypothetical protein